MNSCKIGCSITLIRFLPACPTIMLLPVACQQMPRLFPPFPPPACLKTRLVTSGTCSCPASVSPIRTLKMEAAEKEVPLSPAHKSVAQPRALSSANRDPSPSSLCSRGSEAQGRGVRHRGVGKGLHAHSWTHPPTCQSAQGAGQSQPRLRPPSQPGPPRDTHPSRCEKYWQGAAS